MASFNSSLTPRHSTYLKIKGGHKDFRLNGKQMPAFMYPRDHTYNKDDIEDGLLQGLLPVAVRPIFLRGRSLPLILFRPQNRSIKGPRPLCKSLVITAERQETRRATGKRLWGPAMLAMSARKYVFVLTGRLSI